MSRYIDADALIKHIKNMQWKMTSAAEITKFLFLTTVEEAPTADVVEVRHGEWETIPDCQPNRLLAYRHICSECKNTYKDLNCHGHNYCHWCGAKMDGERRTNDEKTIS